VSPALPSLLSSSPIVVALELHYALASTTHPSPSPIAPGNLAGDPTAAGARHLAVDRPSQAPASQIGPTTVIPYPRPCLGTTPSSQNRDPSGEPPRGLTDGRAPAGSPPPPPTTQRRQPSSPSCTWAHAQRRRPRVVPLLAGQVGEREIGLHLFLMGNLDPYH
jgi:hypothetical protein